MSTQDGESKLGRPLKPGEVLVFSEENYEGNEWLVTKNTSSLDLYFHPASIRIGPNTSVTIFADYGYQGLSQDVPSDLPSFRESKLKDQYPKSLNIWLKASKPFNGYWAIEVTPGHYLSVHADPNGVGVLGTSPKVSEREAFRITDHGEAGPGRQAISLSVRGSPFAKATSSTQLHPLTIDDFTALTLVDEPEAGFRRFSLLTKGNQWIYYNPDENLFLTTADAGQRTIFCWSIKIAEDETQIGELVQGEVALYEQPSYWGKAWVFYADYADFACVEGLNDEISSMLLGPLTGATIYREAQFKADDPKAGKQDVISNLSWLENEQVGENRISSICIWRIVPPGGMGVTVICRLSQDFRGKNQNDQAQSGEVEKNNGGFEEYTAYRTTLRVPHTVETVDVWTTDETQIEVDNQKYPVDEDHPVTLQPNHL